MSFFVLYILFLLFFCTSIHRTHFSFSLPLPALHLFECRHLCEIFIPVSFVVLEQTPTFSKEPAPFSSRSLLEHWWTSQMISGYCLVLVPYLSPTFPKHGLYIHEYIDVHSPERAGRSVAWCERIFDAGVSSQQTLYSASVAICIFLTGLL